MKNNGKVVRITKIPVGRPAVITQVRRAIKKLLVHAVWFFRIRASYKRLAEYRWAYTRLVISIRFAQAWRDDLNGSTPIDWKGAIDAKITKTT